MVGAARWTSKLVGAAHTLIGRRKLVGRKEERKEERKEWASNVDWKK